MSSADFCSIDGCLSLQSFEFVVFEAKAEVPDISEDDFPGSRRSAYSETRPFFGPGPGPGLI